jgi:hypothetical protein
MLFSFCFQPGRWRLHHLVVTPSQWQKQHSLDKGRHDSCTVGAACLTTVWPLLHDVAYDINVHQGSYVATNSLLLIGIESHHPYLASNHLNLISLASWSISTFVMKAGSPPPSRRCDKNPEPGLNASARQVAVTQPHPRPPTTEVRTRRHSSSTRHQIGLHRIPGLRRQSMP